MSFFKTTILTMSILFLLPWSILADEDTDQAWQAFDKKDFAAARIHTQKCLARIKSKADQRQSELKELKEQNKERFRALSRGSLSQMNDKDDPGLDEIKNNRELNDAATSCFIEAEMLRKEGKKNEARKYYQEIVKNYGDAYCFDPKGWYWKVSDVAQDKLDTMDTNYDYEDYKSETLAKKGWQALKGKDFKGAELYAKKCVYLYENEARKMHNSHTQTGISVVKGQEAADWAVNDVATCYYLLGEKALRQGKDQEAKDMYTKAAELGFAVCWDPKGWYWKVAEVAKDKLDNYGTKYDYEDYRSVTLTVKAWKALSQNDFKGVELYTKKCIYLFGNKANDMQSSMHSYAKSSFIPYYWALNDVGTCYFIQAEAYKKQGDLQKAKECYQTIINQYGFSQCWDPRGWYWKIAEISAKKITELP